MARTSSLEQLLDGLDFEVLAGSADIHVERVVTDSRRARPGDVFVCLPGYRSEGGEVRADRHAFAQAAIDAGAVAVVVERPLELEGSPTVIRVADAWHAAAVLAAAHLGRPSRQLTMVGITGTSGKTSTAYFVAAVLRAAGRRTARLGTIDYDFEGHREEAIQTTPEADELQRLLRLAVTRRMDACVMEVSSHALALRRVDEVAFDAAVFTNLSQDHLNFHADMHAYLNAKGRLFQELGSGGKRATAVVNVDDPHSAHIVRVNRGDLLTYGCSTNATVRAEAVHTGLDGTRFRLLTPSGEADVAMGHIGEYQVHNALAAAGVGIALGLDLDAIVAGLRQAPAVPGRFELVDGGQDFRVAVDYAHKPDALERMLRVGRDLHPRRLIVVFGCGGDRDRAKRPVMGRLAEAGSDVAIVTSDNPRNEDPRAIIEEILGGCEGGGAGIVVEPDRGRAIERAIDLAQSGDLVLIAGKGHEAYQLVAGERLAFDDREQARAALRALAARRSSAP